MNGGRGFLWAAGLVGLLATPAAAQPAAVRDPPQAEVDELLKRARREIGQFEQGGGRRDARHPVATWVEKLWAFSPGAICVVDDYCDPWGASTRP